MWVVDIKTNRAEQVLHPGIVGIDSIDEVLVPATDYNLTEREDQKLNFLSANNILVHEFQSFHNPCC